MDKKEIIWKIIEEAPNYEVSNTGMVRNKNTLHIKSLRYTKDGYLRVTLYPTGHSYTIHQLVMRTFYPELRNQCINHIDGNKENNNIENLEWCTVKHNNIHRSKMHPNSSKGERNSQAILNNEQAMKIKYGIFDGLNNREIGDLFGVSSEVVRRIRSGERWKHI